MRFYNEMKNKMLKHDYTLHYNSPTYTLNMDIISTHAASFHSGFPALVAPHNAMQPPHHQKPKIMIMMTIKKKRKTLRTFESRAPAAEYAVSQPLHGVPHPS
jgi:hypothetical protein